MISSSEPWALEGGGSSDRDDGGGPAKKATASSGASASLNSNAEIVIEKQTSVNERIAYLKSRMAPDAPKVGNSGNNSSDMSRAAGEAAKLEDRWKGTAPSSRDDGGGGGDGNGNAPAGDGGVVVDDGEDLWQSAMKRFEQESQRRMADAEEEINHNHGSKDERWDAVGRFEDDDDDDDSDEDPPQSQTKEQFERRMADMDRMSDLEMEYEDQQPEGGRQPSHRGDSDIDENLSLWQTFRVLYKRNAMIKYYIIGLLILLLAAAAIIVVSLVQKKNDSSGKECASGSSYADSNAAFLLLPEEESQNNVRAGDFGISLSASPEFLVVGAPNTACIGPPCKSTLGGGAYLYRRRRDNGNGNGNSNGNNRGGEWDLQSTFVLDDGVSAGDEFGRSVAISHDSSTVVVGAPMDDGGIVGIVAGAIYVMEGPFDVDTGGGDGGAGASSPTRLTPLDIGFNDKFGGSVSVASTTLGDGDTPVRVTNIVAGASYDDDWGSNSGGVYVFAKFDDPPPSDACGGDYQVGSWIQCQKLLPDDGESNDLFGRTVDVSGRTIVVGAMWDDDLGIDAGAAYVYSLDDRGNWSLQQKLLPRNFYSHGNRFGVSVATSGRRIVVGADLDDALGDDSGAAYIFDLSNGVWELKSKLVPTKRGAEEDHSGHECGYAVSIGHDGKEVVVGCSGGGMAYVYRLQENGITWVQTETLTVPEGHNVAGSRMGNSVTQNEDMAIVGYGKSNGDVFSYSKGC